MVVCAFAHTFALCFHTRLTGTSYCSGVTAIIGAVFSSSTMGCVSVASTGTGSVAALGTKRVPINHSMNRTIAVLTILMIISSWETPIVACWLDLPVGRSAITLRGYYLNETKANNLSACGHIWTLLVTRTRHGASIRTKEVVNKEKLG